MAVSEDPFELKLKRDQIFGLHVCVPNEKVDAVCATLRGALEFERAWPGIDRLNEPGRTTLLLFESVEDSRETLARVSELGRLAREIETLPPRYEGVFAELLHLGEPEWSSKSPVDCAAWGFTQADVVSLIRIVSDPELACAPCDSSAVWAPIHAVRALGCLRAEAAVEPLLAAWRGIEKHTADYLEDEIAVALAAIGPASRLPTAALLGDETRADHLRLAAARTLSLLALKHPESRDASLAALASQLDAHAVQKPGFNGFLVSALLDARAVEAAASLERAFANNRVDESIAGDWEDVQIELGLKQLRDHPPKPNRLTLFGAQFRASMGIPAPLDGASETVASAPIATPSQPLRAPPKVGRNDPCPCGSGKKYKKCCGA